MKTMTQTLAVAAALVLSPMAVQADAEKDCLLQGTLNKDPGASAASMEVTFHSIKRYDNDANCRMRRGEKLQFKMPKDTRLEQAPDGSRVEYRYREGGENGTSTELLRVGTST